MEHTMDMAKTIDQVEDFTDKLTFKRIIDIQHLAEKTVYLMI